MDSCVRLCPRRLPERRLWGDAEDLERVQLHGQAVMGRTGQAPRGVQHDRVRMLGGAVDGLTQIGDRAVQSLSRFGAGIAGQSLVVAEVRYEKAQPDGEEHDR